MNTAALYVFFACFGQYCLGPETRIISGLTEAQCGVLITNYDPLAKIEDGKSEKKDFRYAICIDPNGRHEPHR
jgi:hypothetical protein